MCAQPSLPTQTLFDTLQAGYLLSLKSLTSMLLFLLILPGVTTYFSKFHGVSVRKINLTVARVSIALLAAGSMLVGISTSPRLLIPGQSVHNSNFDDAV
jgi:hypothetical protein